MPPTHQRKKSAKVSRPSPGTPKSQKSRSDPRSGDQVPGLKFPQACLLNSRLDLRLANVAHNPGSSQAGQIVTSQTRRERCPNIPCRTSNASSGFQLSNACTQYATLPSCLWESQLFRFGDQDTSLSLTPLSASVASRHRDHSVTSHMERSSALPGSSRQPGLHHQIFQLLSCLCASCSAPSSRARSQCTQLPSSLVWNWTSKQG